MPAQKAMRRTHASDVSPKGSVIGAKLCFEGMPKSAHPPSYAACRPEYVAKLECVYLNETTFDTRLTTDPGLLSL